jgi:L-fuconolactonase
MEDVIWPDLPICDPHHHLWDFETSTYLLPQLLADTGSGHRIDSTVFVECQVFYRSNGPDPMKYVGETEFVNGVAAMAASGHYGPTQACAAIVSRADLSEGAAVREVLEAHIAAGNGRFRGIRHAAAHDPSPEIRESHTRPPAGLLGSEGFRAGFRQLADLGLTFDAWVFHPQIDEVTDLARAFPDASIILDHVGGVLGIGPYLGKRDEVFAQWSMAIRTLALQPNVTVKLGGLGMTQLGFGFHKQSPLPGSEVLAAAWRPYIETCIEAFGVERCMFESNYPVDGPSCTYRTLWNTFKRISSGASEGEKAALFKQTAERVYRIAP